jgi:hypothetical protein
MGPLLIIVSTPILQLFAGPRKRKEPMMVQAHRAEPAVERLEEGIVGRFARTGEVERHALLISPQIQISRHELRALIYLDGLGIANLAADPLQGGDHVLARKLKRGSSAGT